ncbi:flagellar export protein FliJ [Solirubrobacter sp. CPCC 204708]|uniref:Flagellar FliJ protein n=1 Tax=Solirubrobacter deserti TaxID=2282478 RepID=A0ABT4RMG3_9ACTN|nr:flagellar export protein FliJ [Solirubrobacter deserti]MBE2316927.1 flagellar export protein FliJ [Solirubrobacter deserti]MDA0139758.1 flagellar export protein FliJ [Solirubrobacter deserti]
METPSFTFRLERVRTLRERAEEEAREALTQEIRHRDEGQTLLDEARADVRAACEMNRNAMASGGLTSAVNLRAIQNYVERTEQLQSHAAIELSRREAEVEAKRDHLAAAARDRQAIEKLKERQQAEHNAEWAVRIQNTLDELALAVHRRGVVAA